MVIAKTTAKVLLALFLFVSTIFVTVIAQLYAPTVLWILSFLAIILAAILSYIAKQKTTRIMVVCILSVLICGNYLILSVTEGSLLGLGYVTVLLSITWLLLFSLSETIASLRPKDISGYEP